MEWGLQRKGPGNGKAWLTPLDGVGWPHIWNLWICFFSRLVPRTWVSELGGQGPPRRTTVLPSSTRILPLP